jgi:hypothetical protein
MPFVVALLVWTALSIPVALVVGRVLAAADAPARVPTAPRPRTYASG